MYLSFIARFDFGRDDGSMVILRRYGVSRVGQFYYNESTFQHWVAAHVSREADLDAIPVSVLVELRLRYREEIDSIPINEDLIAAPNDNKELCKESADVAEAKNAIRYYRGSEELPMVRYPAAAP